MSDDPKISQRYRELGAEEPPRHVDEAILAASRRAVDARPAPLVAPTGRRRWYFPVAAAAVVMLAAGVALHVERDQADVEMASVMMKQQVPEPQARADAPARQEQEMRAPAPAVQPPAEKKAVESAPEKPPVSVGMREERAMRAPAPAAPAPAPAPAQEPSAKRFAADPPRAVMSPEAKQEQQAQDRVVVQAQRADEAARDRRASSASARPNLELGAAGAVALGKLADEPPEKWVERIAELRKAGQHDEADKLLEEFRKRYPDYKVPESALRK